MEINQFYVYVWSDEEGNPYYVGKGSGDRAYCSRPTGYPQPPTDKGRVSIYPCDSEDLAFDLEMELVSRYGRLDQGTGTLENKTSGGNGKIVNSKVGEYKGKHLGLTKRNIMSKVPEVVTVEEDLYYVIQCAAKGALCRFINPSIEVDDLANELYIRWKETGLKPKFRRLTYKGKPTNPSVEPSLPMGKWILYKIFKNDCLDILDRENRRVKREELMVPRMSYTE